MTTDQQFLLEGIFLAASDYLLGLDIPEFAEEYGGIDKFLDNLRYVVKTYDEKFNTIGDDE